jgi:hypothetical protein
VLAPRKISVVDVRVVACLQELVYGIKTSGPYC